jgi:hypothetical protein
MANKFTLSVGQAHELEMAMNRNGGWDATLLKVLCGGSNLRRIRDVFLGEAVICYLVNRGANPWKPKKWKIIENRGINETMVEQRTDDLLLIDGHKVELFLHPNQHDKRSVLGKDLLSSLESVPRMCPLNANYLHFFLSHKELIPDSWKKDEDGRPRFIFFWYTVYVI